MLDIISYYKYILIPACFPTLTCPSGPVDCQEIYDNGHTVSGTCAICINGASVLTYCDMDTASGIGWTAFQKRIDNSVSFEKTWTEYADGFGDPNNCFWLGLDNLYTLTSSRSYEMQVDIEDGLGDSGSALYTTFDVGNSVSNYVLNIGGFTAGTPVDAGDSITNAADPWGAQLNGMPFTTHDVDNDANPAVNCAVSCRGGWWHRACQKSNLNGFYSTNPSYCNFDSVRWKSFKGTDCTMFYSMLKLKRA